MTAIAGISNSERTELVNEMLDQMSHRGSKWRQVVQKEGTTLGLSGNRRQERAVKALQTRGIARDAAGRGRLASAQALAGGFILKRDALGVAPLYYGWTEAGELCFASEVKGLLPATRDVHELLPGHRFDGKTLTQVFKLAVQEPLQASPQEIAAELRQRLENAVESVAQGNTVGSWLSGGLDSSCMAALASPYVETLHTFAAGLEGAPDLTYARIMADAIHAEHHEVLVEPETFLNALPGVIEALESFDALLVRSSVMNYLVSNEASHYVPAVFSGEGGDELFAGYEYLKEMEPAQLPAELVDIAGRLHNTALQRVDRSASAHGTVAHVCFLDPGVVEYALRIPAEYKLRNGVEKWILREAVSDLIPDEVLNRTKAKFWEGAGVEDMIVRHVEDKISDGEFEQERQLPNGWLLNSKEELLYYRIFKARFGEFADPSWMGRTKGAPIS